MTIIGKWYQLVTLMKPQFIIKLGFVWWKNVLELAKVLLKQWWPLIILLIAGFAGLFDRAFTKIYGSNSHDGDNIFVRLGGEITKMISVGLATKILLGLAIGMWLGAILLTTHPSMLPKGRDYYRPHLLLFLLVTIAVAVAYLHLPITILGFKTNSWPMPWLLELKELWLIFACFFILDARPSVQEYLRAAIILPLKLLIFNLPITILLYLVLIPVHWVHPAVGLFALAPLFIVACGILYKLAVNNHYEDYYGSR